MTTTEIPHFTQTIRHQVGVATLMAVGARDFVYSDTETDRYLQFKVTGQRGYHTAVKITLEPSDTYTVTLIRMHKRTFDIDNLDTQDLVYADSLTHVVRKMCGE